MKQNIDHRETHCRVGMEFIFPTCSQNRLVPQQECNRSLHVTVTTRLDTLLLYISLGCSVLSEHYALNFYLTCTGIHPCTQAKNLLAKS